MQRRDLVRLLAAAPLAGASGRLLAAPAAGGAKLLVVFLRGAYDCANVLVPTASDFYYAARPNIAIARPGEPHGALALDAHWGLHPALAASLMPMVQGKQLAFIPFAGTDDLTRSHFETQDSIELGQALDQRRDYRSGFLNRLALVLGAGPLAEVAPIAFTDRLPLSMRGEAKAVNMALTAVPRQGIDERQSQVIQAMYRNTALAQPVREGFEVRDEVLVGADVESYRLSVSDALGRTAELEAIIMQEREDGQ